MDGMGKVGERFWRKYVKGCEVIGLMFFDGTNLH